MRKRSTSIDEYVRQELRITRDDYALCAYVQYRQADRRGRVGWCVDTKQEIADFVGITRPGLYKMFDRLSAKDLLFIEPDSGALQVTPRWIDAENYGKQSLQNSVNKVYTNRKQSLQSSVNIVTHNISVKKDNKEERGRNKEEQKALSVTTHTPQHSINDLQIKTVEYEEFEIKERKLTDEEMKLVNQSEAEAKEVFGAIRKVNNPPATNPVKEIVEFLNEKAESQFRHTSKATAAQIKARMKEGYTVDDFKAVIAFKADQWGRDSKMSEYLRPTTLFRPSHFEGYLNAAKKALNGNGPAADRPTANTPDGLLKEISEWYHANPEVWNEAKRYAVVQGWAAQKLKAVVQKYCARQIADGRGSDTFDQHNARIQVWFLTETTAAFAAPSMNCNGRALAEPKSRV